MICYIKNYNKRMSHYGFSKSEKEYTELSHVVKSITLLYGSSTINTTM